MQPVWHHRTIILQWFCNSVPTLFQQSGRAIAISIHANSNHAPTKGVKWEWEQRNFQPRWTLVALAKVHPWSRGIWKPCNAWSHHFGNQRLDWDWKDGRFWGFGIGRTLRFECRVFALVACRNHDWPVTGSLEPSKDPAGNQSVQKHVASNPPSVKKTGTALPWVGLRWPGHGVATHWLSSWWLCLAAESQGICCNHPQWGSLHSCRGAVDFSHSQSCWDSSAGSFRKPWGGGWVTGCSGCNPLWLIAASGHSHAWCRAFGETRRTLRRTTVERYVDGRCSSFASTNFTSLSLVFVRSPAVQIHIHTYAKDHWSIASDSSHGPWDIGTLHIGGAFRFGSGSCFGIPWVDGWRSFRCSVDSSFGWNDAGAVSFGARSGREGPWKVPKLRCAQWILPGQRSMARMAWRWRVCGCEGGRIGAVGWRFAATKMLQQLLEVV